MAIESNPSELCNEANESEISALSARLFSNQSGLDTANVERLLRPRNLKSVKQWDLQKLMEKKEELAVVRTACTDLHRGRDEFASGVMEIESGLKNRMEEAPGAITTLADDKSSLFDILRR